MNSSSLDPRAYAQALIDAGIPVVVCKPVGGKKELYRPDGWQLMTAADCDLSGYRPGVDTLAMVAGHGVDVVDVDTKDGGSLDHLPPFQRFGLHLTPSGGWHAFVRGTGIGKISPFKVNRKHVGDYAGGTVDGGKRLLVYLPGSSRPRYPGADYQIVEPLDLAALLESDPDEQLVDVLLGAGGSYDGEPGSPAADRQEVLDFLAEHSTQPERQCNYGRKVIADALQASHGLTYGDPVLGRHAWAARSATRTVELMRAGCAWAGDLEALKERALEMKPEEDFHGIIAWALTNADGVSKCGIHSGEQWIHDQSGDEEPKGHSPEEESGEPVTDLWAEREVLTLIHTWARARMVAPTAVLGAVLARIAASVPPWVVLPALVGGHGSLDLFVAQVGPSGSGKGASDATARAMLDLDIGVEQPRSTGAGSGEGIAHLFAKRTRDGVERHTTAALLTIPEVDTLAALRGRQGSTLMPELRKAWSGEGLGFAYADPAKRLPVEAFTYRLCVLLGVQPGRAEVLFEDEDGGTPQRLLWVPTVDPSMPDEVPDDPPMLSWKYPAWPIASIDGKAVLPICDEAVSTIRKARLERVRGNGEALDGHALLTRLKIAAVLGLLDGRAEVIDDDWRIAGRIMVISDRTREAAKAALVRKQKDADLARGRRDGRREVVKADVVEGAEVAKTGRAIMTRLRGADWVSHSVLRRGLRSDYRRVLDEAIEQLIKAGQIEAETTEYRGQSGRRYRAATGGAR